MHTVRELLKAPDAPQSVARVVPDTTVLKAAARMNELRIGSLMVMVPVLVDSDTRTQIADLVGIVTERDILTQVVAANRDPATTTVGEIMTKQVLTCTPDTTIDEARRVMREHRVRHLPVIDEAELVGMLSIGDLNIAETATLTETIRYLETYISQG